MTRKNVAEACAALSAHGRQLFVERLGSLERDLELWAKCARLDIGEDETAERDVADCEASLIILRSWIASVRAAAEPEPRPNLVPGAPVPGMTAAEPEAKADTYQPDWAAQLCYIHREWAVVYAGKQVAIHRTRGIIASGATFGEVHAAVARLGLKAEDVVFDSFEARP